MALRSELSYPANLKPAGRGGAELIAPWPPSGSFRTMDENSGDAAPPQYTASSTSTPGDCSSPPSYYPGETPLPVRGDAPNDSFVAAAQFKAHHLGLLRTFRELKDRVTNLEANQDVRNKLP